MLEQIFDLLTEDKVRFLVSIDLKENDNEQAIFNTVNSSGVILSGADIIKNLLYERYVDLLRQEKTNSADVDKYAIKIYKNTWESAFLADEKVDAYWNAKRQYGRMTRSNLETFLYSFAVIKGFFNPAEDNAIDLSKKYKEKVDSFDRKHLEKFLAELSEYADVYQDNFIMGKDELTYDDYVRRLFVICGALEVATFYPYLLQLLYQHEKGKIDNNEMKAKFFALERYIVANAICRGSTKNYNNECVQLVQNRKDPDDIFEGCVYLTKDQFKSGLRHMKLNKVPNVLLFCVELYKRKTSKSDIKKLSYNFTLEHIMPQKWEKNWSDVPVKNQEGKTVKDKDEIEKIRKYTIYQIGNMTLLNSKLNSSVSNGTFKEKVYGKNGKPGLKAQADLMLTKEVIDQHKKWDDIAVYSRTEVLEDIIAKMWNLSGLPEEKEVVQKKNSTSFKSLRKEYWEFALDKLNKTFGDESPYANRNATDDSWMSGKVGVSGFRVNCVFVDDEARVEIALRNRDIKKNKEAFEYLLSKKTRIEKDLGVKLTWSPASKDKKKAMISYSCLDVSIADKETWDAAADFHAEWAKNMCDVILPYLQELYPQISW